MIRNSGSKVEMKNFVVQGSKFELQKFRVRGVMRSNLIPRILFNHNYITMEKLRRNERPKRSILILTEAVSHNLDKFT